MRIKHETKVKMARRMLTREERTARGKGEGSIFTGKAWEHRRTVRALKHKLNNPRKCN